MPLANLRDLMRGVTVTSTNLPQIFARHAVQSVNTFRMFARRHQQVIEGLPVVPPVQIKAYTLTKLIFINLPPPPFIQDVLIAGKNCLDPQYYRTPAI